MADSETEGKSGLDLALEEGFGYSISDITFASERAVAEILAECMVSRGWEYEYQLPERFDPSSIERLTAAEQALLDLDQWELATQPDREETPPEYQRDEAECWDKANEEAPNPMNSAWGWLAEETEDLYLRVSSDPRVVEAKTEEERCIANAGYDPSALNDISNDLVAKAHDVVAAVRNGETNHDDALETLARMAAEERQLWDATDPCVEARLKVAGFVARELEEEWLEENGDRLSAVVAELEDDLAELSDQFAMIAEES